MDHGLAHRTSDRQDAGMAGYFTPSQVAVRQWALSARAPLLDNAGPPHYTFIESRCRATLSERSVPAER